MLVPKTIVSLGSNYKIYKSKVYCSSGDLIVNYQVTWNNVFFTIWILYCINGRCVTGNILETTEWNNNISVSWQKLVVRNLPTTAAAGGGEEMVKQQPDGRVSKQELEKLGVWVYNLFVSQCSFSTTSVDASLQRTQDFSSSVLQLKLWTIRAWNQSGVH